MTSNKLWLCIVFYYFPWQRNCGTKTWKTEVLPSPEEWKTGKLQSPGPIEKITISEPRDTERQAFSSEVFIFSHLLFNIRKEKKKNFPG